jgi:hypothetical protein
VVNGGGVVEGLSWKDKFVMGHFEKKKFRLWWGLFLVPQFQRSNNSGFFGFMYLNSSVIFFCWNVPTSFVVNFTFQQK